jgi:hypothetical protein
MDNKFFTNQLIFLTILISIYFIFESTFLESEFRIYVVILVLISLIGPILFSLFNIFYKNSDNRNFSYENINNYSPWKGFVNSLILIFILLLIPALIIPYLLSSMIGNIYPWCYFIFAFYAFYIIFLMIKNLDIFNFFFNTHFIRKNLVNIENHLLMIRLIPHMDSEIYFTNDGIYWNMTNSFFSFYKWDYFSYYVEDLVELYPLSLNTIGLFVKKEYQNTYPKKFGRRDIIQIPLKNEYKESLLNILNNNLSGLKDVKNNF